MNFPFRALNSCRGNGERKIKCRELAKKNEILKKEVAKGGKPLNILAQKLKDVSLSVLPITLLVLLLHFTIVPVESAALLRFLLGAVSVVLGLGIFLFGAQIGITPPWVP